jgi:D12 class N6 adenine-specific DNA methyltransferase
MSGLAQPGPRPEGLAAFDDRVRARLAGYAFADDDHWAFSERGSRVEEARTLFQYPAMMVPAMQRELMEAIVELQPGVSRIADPFAGGGTVQSEAMLMGLDVVSQDINPLAILLCRIKAECLDPAMAEAAGKHAIEAAEQDASADSGVDFKGLTKWFRPEAAADLGRLRRAIQGEADPRARRFLWATLAETVRLTSNSRTSTFKLHIRPAERIAALPAVIPTFRKLLDRNTASQRAFLESLRFRGRLKGGVYAGSVHISHGDTIAGLEGELDLLVTSPPYGDNASTVPYGQASYLALQWINFGDISSDLGQEWLRTTLEIDRRSLGGKSAVEPDAGALADLVTRSPSLAATLGRLSALPSDRVRRVFAFIHDLDRALGPISRSMRENAYLVWTVGNRQVGGQQVPLDSILTELLGSREVLPVGQVERRITGKRMAHRNSIATTMIRERTLVFRKHATPGHAS